MKKRNKYVAEVVIETDGPMLKKNLKRLITISLEETLAHDTIKKVRVRSVDED